MLKKIKKIAFILFGNLLVAVGTVFFVVPGGFITGGITGVALALHAFFDIPLPLGIAGLSLLMLIIALIFLGKEFAASTALSSISFPVFVWICEQTDRFIDFGTENLFLNIASATLLYGYGIALVMKQGASTGGLDTVAMILNRKRGVSLPLAVTVFEVISMTTQVYYSSYDGIISGVLITIFFTALMNHTLSRGISKVQVQIYSRYYKEINEVILSDFDRGSTLFRIEGGFSHKEGYALQTIVSNREIFRLKEAITKIDPLAFVTVSEISEVRGRGFSIE